MTGRAVPGPAIVVMGVSGAGKTTVARAVAQALSLAFVDADDLHPLANVSKMRAGRPLEDADRWPWLGAVARRIAADRRSEGGVVVACSALRRPYRDVLRDGAEGAVWFAELDVDGPALRRRLEARVDHFMPASLVGSQLAALEPLQPDELGERFAAGEGAAAVAAEVIRAVRASVAGGGEGGATASAAAGVAP